jgi:rhamnose utilization protein RhaD (predicted bifunctional aldolase and dehydrogenase)
MTADNNCLNRLCVSLAADSLLIQGSGGNISIKDGNTLYIKASGFSMSDALAKNIFISVSRSEVLATLNAGNEIASLCNIGGGG